MLKEYHMSQDKEMGTEELLRLCNREEEFKKQIYTLLSVPSVEQFNDLLDTSEEMPPSMEQFINDLRAIYEDTPLRTFVQRILTDQITPSQLRGIDHLISSQILQAQRVRKLNDSMLADARETITTYLPAFENMMVFFQDLDNDSRDFDSNYGLRDEFIAEITEAIKSDERVTPKLLLKICHEEQFRKSFAPELDDYPKAVHYIFGLADQLVNAQRYLAEIEIDDMLHDIEDKNL